MNEERIQAALGEAIEAFNRGRWHDALDLFEGPCRSLAGVRREVYLGLVRLSAAFYHEDRGHPVSARRLLASSREILARHAPVAEGLDLAALLAALEPGSGAGAGGSGEVVSRPPRPRLRRAS